MERPRPAEGDERELPRIVPALDRDEPQRAQHLGVHDRDDRGRDRSRRAHARPRRDRARRPPASSVGQPSEDEVRIRDGRAGPAAAVTRRSGLGTGALGPDAQRTALVPPGDRAPAGADRVHVDARQANRIAGDLALGCCARPRRRRSRRRPSRFRPCRSETAFSTPADPAAIAAPTDSRSRPGEQARTQDGPPPPRSLRLHRTSA